MNKRRVLITGGAGFVGFHLARKLSQNIDIECVLLDNLSRGQLDDDLETLIDRDNVRLVTGDIMEESTFEHLDKGFDEVYHLAAVIGVRNVMENPLTVLNVNAAGTLLLLNWFVNGGGKKILFSSTSEAYAWTKNFHEIPIPTPEDVPLSLTELKNPRSTYAGSKIFGELAVTQYCKVHNLPFTIVRYHNVYGPRMGYEHVIPELYERALEGQNPLTVFSANHSRAFCYIKDAVDATILAMQKQTSDGRTINIGNDLEEVSIGYLAKKILYISKINVEISSKQAENDPIVRRCPDISRARKLLDYEPQTMLDEGLDLTLNWYASQLRN